MEDYQLAIERLRSYDMSKVPYDIIKRDVSVIAKFGCMGMMFHKGKAMIRARPNDSESPFSSREALQYVPATRNKKFGRASSPNNTMFYAAVVPDEVKDDELDNPRRTATLEVSQILRPTTAVAEEEEGITYSRWVVTDDIPLLAICYHKDFVRRSAHTAELYNAYLYYLHHNTPALSEKSLFVTDFLAREFAKGNPFDTQTEYLISAAFTDLAVANGIGGIYYPTVRDNNLCYNVAIAPAYVDRCLKLVSAGECTIYKHPCGTIVDNNTVCLIDDDSQPFKMLPVDSTWHKGRDKVLEELRAQCK